MKKIFILFVLTSIFAQAQFTIKGTMNPPYKNNWILLYKIEGARQVFIKNTTAKIDTIAQKPVATFQFNLPKDAKTGSYRVTYDTRNRGFVDFLFNKEDIEFTFNPKYPNQSIVFSKSNENILYKEYIAAISVAQHQLDSVQVSELKKPSENNAKNYITALQKVISVQNTYLKKTKNKMVAHFVKATLRKNSPKIISSMQSYINYISDNFFKNMDLEDPILYNSSFLVDRITDYVFYLNYNEDFSLQQKLYKESIAKVLSKIKNTTFKKDVIEFLITQFEAQKNVDLVDSLFANYYDKLPETYQNKDFKTKKLAALAVEIGRIAPDFSWKENEKSYKLSTLNDANSYLLVFWSTGCSHCLQEIPKLYTFMKDNPNTKVIAFSLEKTPFTWKNYIANLKGWHNVLGLNKWENKTSRTYRITSTPSYFILDKNKKIVGKPEHLKDVKQFFGSK